MQGGNSHAFTVDASGNKTLTESDLDDFMNQNVYYRLCVYAEDNAGNYKIECSASNKEFKEN